MSRSSELVREVVENDAAIRICLERGLINVRALARYIQTSEGRAGDEITYEALVNAVHRYPAKVHSVNFQELRKYFMHRRAVMKNNIADITLINDSDMPIALSKLSSEIDYGRGETFNVVAGVEITRLVIDEKNLKKMSDIIPKKNVVQTETDLSEIVISMDPVTHRVPGIVYTLASEMALNGINVLEFMTCSPEIIIVVATRDGIKAYQTIESIGRR